MSLYRALGSIDCDHALLAHDNNLPQCYVITNCGLFLLATVIISNISTNEGQL